MPGVAVHAAPFMMERHSRMGRFIAVLLVAAFASTASLSLPARAAAAPQESLPASSFTAQQRKEIVEILRNALRTDPTILRDAIEALQAEEGQRQEATARAGITAMADALTRNAADPVAGNPTGDVTIVEFYDVRCPYCRRMVPVMADLLGHDRNVRVVYKDIPILGPGSVLGAKALLAAQKQGGYLKLHAILMAGSPNIDQDSLQAAAGRAGLDWDRLQRDMAAPEVQARIDANLRLAQALQIHGTPAYIIGERLLPGAVELAELQDAVALARKR
jgi:protein-disulfide isomerase